MASQRSGELQYISHAGGPYRPDDWQCRCGRMNIAVSNRCIICSTPHHIPVKLVQVGWECGCLVRINGVSEPKINQNSVISCGKCGRIKYSASQVHQVSQTKPSRFTPNIKLHTVTVMELSRAPQNPPNSPVQPDPDAMDVEFAAPTETGRSILREEPEPEPIKPTQPIKPLCGKCNGLVVDEDGYCERCGSCCGKETERIGQEQIKDDADSWLCDLCGMYNSPNNDYCTGCVTNRKPNRPNKPNNLYC